MTYLTQLKENKMEVIMLKKIKEIISMIQKEDDIEEIEYDDTKAGVHVKVRRKV